MTRPRFELADIFREYGNRYRQAHDLPAQERRVMWDIEQCRTARLGGHLEQCDGCDFIRVSYNSCGNRHCPKCQSLAKAEWLDQQQENLLPVPYFHVVLTLPGQLSELALQNKRVIYGLLFRAASQALQRIAADPKHLGAEIGFLAVLHTWGQTLSHHPHLHCVVPGGGLSSDGQSWVACRPGFFLPVRVLSRLFRGLFLDYLQQAFDKDQLSFHGRLEPLAAPAKFAKLRRTLCRLKWVVYAKRPFGGPAQVLNYLGRYTHRVAISNHRLLDFSNRKVTFSWRDYQHGNRLRTMILDAEDFIARFLLHVLPRHFVRIRHFGFLSNPHRGKKLELCRQLLKAASSPEPQPAAEQTWKERYQALTGEAIDLCPACHQGHLHTIAILLSLTASSVVFRPLRIAGVDSS